MTESSASNVSQQGNDLDLARIPSPGKSINSGNTIVDTGLKTTPPVSKTRKKKKSKTTKLTPTAISSVKPASGKGSMISSVENDVSNDSNVSNIISLQASPSTCGMVEAGEVDLGVGSSHCTGQIEQPPLVPTKSPGPDLGSLVDGGGFSHLIQELVRKQVEASVAQLVQNNPSQLPYQELTTGRENYMSSHSLSRKCLGDTVSQSVESAVDNECFSWVPPSGGPGEEIPNPRKSPKLGSFPSGEPGNMLNPQRHSQTMGPGLNNSAGTMLRPPVSGLGPSSTQQPSREIVGKNYGVPSLPSNYVGRQGTRAPAVSWNRAPAPGTRAPAPRNPQIPYPTGLGIIGGIVPIPAHNVVLGRDNPMRPNTITGSLQGFPIQRFVTPKPHRDIYRTPYTVPNMRASAPVRVIRPTCSRPTANIAQPFSWPRSGKENMAPQGKANMEESQQYIAPGNPIHSRTYKNIEELDATDNELTPQLSEKPDDQESDYLTFPGKLDIIRQVLGDAIPQETGNKAEDAPTSLLSAIKRKKEPLSSLPLAQVVRGTLRSVGEKARDQCKLSKPQPNSDGIVVKETPGLTRKKFYKPSSHDFTLTQPELSKDILSELGDRCPSMILGKPVSKDIEENIRLNLATSSLNEWLLATIQTILQSCHNQLVQSDQLPSLSTNIQTCLDMLGSVGIASATGIKAASTALVELTVARRDSIIKNIPNLSNDLRQELRVLPLVGETNQPEMGDKPGLLFRGKSDQFTSDRKLEADKATQQLVLKLQSLKSAPIPSKRRQTGPDPRPKKIRMSPQNQPFPAPQRGRGRGRGNSSRGNPSRGKPRGRGTYPATKSNHI